MSILKTQNILASTGGDDGGQTSFAAYSFGPSMSKRGSPESTEVGKFQYNSPTRSYAPESTMQDALGQGNLGEGVGVDGTSIKKGATDTTYGPNADANGVVSKMSDGDSSLLTGIARVLSGKIANPKYHAIDYFTTRTPKATRSYHRSENPGGNKGGSGVERPYFTSNAAYPDEILTNSNGGEFVPQIPTKGGGTGLINLIPKTAGDTNTSTDHYEDTNASRDNSEEESNFMANEGEVEVNDDSVVVVDPAGHIGSDPAADVVANLNDSEGGDVTFDPEAFMATLSWQNASTGFSGMEANWRV